MVSFWPFKGDDRSAASFEKILSALSSKITRASTRNDKLRQNQRRFRVLWTLYTGFAYLIAVLILTLVTGWSNWTATEYTGLGAGPVVIYSVRLAIETYYNYRVSNSQAYLNDLYKQREAAIGKLKAATKYDSTQQLLDKYGGGGASPTQTQSQSKKRRSGETQQLQLQRSPGAQPARTGIPPPPTANIPNRRTTLPPADPATSTPQSLTGPPSTPPSEEFAPNAFDHPPHSPTIPGPPFPQATPEYASSKPRWYDRLMDVVLGEDETAPSNRVALICRNCRLVNGQAPPGTRSLEDLGRWRCGECKAWNGQERAAAMHEMVEGRKEDSDELGERSRTSEAGLRIKSGNVRDETEEPGEDEGNEDEEEERELLDEDNAGDGALDATPPSASTRSSIRRRKN